MKQLVYIFILLILSSCMPHDTLKDTDKRQVVKEVINMLENYHQDIAKDGLTAEFAYLDNSREFFWVPPGYTTPLSYDSVRNILATNAKGFKQIDFGWDTLQIFPLSKTIATYTGIVDGVMIDTAGTKTAMKIIESGTIIKRTDGWKLLSGQSAVLKSE